MNNPFPKGVKKSPLDPISSEENLPDVAFSEEEMMDFWEGLSALLKQHMSDVKVIVWGDDNGFASIHIGNVRSAIMEFRDSNVPVLCLSVAIPSNVAAKLALVIDKYCLFTLGQIFSHTTGNFVWGSDAIVQYFEDVYETEKERRTRLTKEAEKVRPKGELLH